jgi:hypothetical protein
MGIRQAGQVQGIGGAPVPQSYLNNGGACHAGPDAPPNRHAFGIPGAIADHRWPHAGHRINRVVWLHHLEVGHRLLALGADESGSHRLHLRNEASPLSSSICNFDGSLELAMAHATRDDE